MRRLPPPLLLPLLPASPTNQCKTSTQADQLSLIALLTACRKLPTLKVTEQRGLGPWQPGSSTAPPKLTVSQQAAAAAAGGVVEEEASYSYEELLLQLPGLQRQLRLAAQERAGLPPAEREVDVVYHPDARMDRPLQPPLSEWDLRAKMEKRKRQQREIDGERAGPWLWCALAAQRP